MRNLRISRLSVGLAGLSGVLTAAVGLLVLTGWTFDIEVVKSIIPGFVTMKPLTAVCFVLAGIALRLQVGTPLRSPLPAIRVAWICASASSVVGLITLVEYTLGRGLGIDDLLFHRAVHATTTLYPGRMSPVTAALFLLTGIALLLLDYEFPGGFRPAPYIGLATALTGVVALLGYLYSVGAVSEFSSYTALALHTTVLFLILGCGILFARVQRSFVAEFSSTSAGGVMARRLLPLVVGGPFLIGYLRMAGEHAHLYSSGVGFAVAAAFNISLYGVVVWLVARELNRADAERQQAAERDSRLAAIVDYSEDAIVGADLDGAITSWNQGATRIFGYSEPEALGRAIQSLIVPADRLNESEQFRQEIAAGQALTQRETVRARKDGRAVQVALTISPIRDSRARIVGMASIARDITARKQIEAEARAAEERLREHARILDLAQVMIRDLQSRIVLWNRGSELLYGYTAGEAIGRVSHELLGTEFPEPLESIEEKLRATGGWEGELAHRKKSGERIVVASKWVLHSAGGRPARVLETNSDITALKRAEDSLIQSQKMQAMGTLAGGIAHDFNNILLAILGHASFAADDLPPDHPVQKDIAAITKASERASDLVRQILTFSRSRETMRVVTKLQPVVEEALHLLRSTLPAMIEITSEFAAAASVSIDRTQVHQIVMNLGTNAAHAMGDAGGQFEVRIEEAVLDVESAHLIGDLPPGSYVRLSIHDSGSGMNQATLKRIFDPFFTTKAPGKGTGLGLAVVHGIMKSHGGAIAVYSEPGKGTTFQLYFPAVAGSAESGTEPATPSPRGNGEHILCIDDERPILAVLARMLEGLGYRVTAHMDASAALQDFDLRPEAFDVVVTDLALRGMSGLDLAEAFRKTRPEIPVVMSSGYFSDENIQRAHQLGIEELIVKPNTLIELGNALQRVLAARAARA